MRVTIRQKNLKITPALTTYIEAKVLKPLKRRLKTVISKDLPILDLEFGRVTRHHRKGMVYHAEATLSIGKRIVRAEVNAEDIRQACDLLEQELDHELQSFKEKQLSLDKRMGRKMKQEIRYDSSARFKYKGRVRNEGN